MFLSVFFIVNHFNKFLISTIINKHYEIYTFENKENFLLNSNSICPTNCEFEVTYRRQVDF